jgi:hypothetical protein
MDPTALPNWSNFGEGHDENVVYSVSCRGAPRKIGKVNLASVLLQALSPDSPLSKRKTLTC